MFNRKRADSSQDDNTASLQFAEVSKDDDSTQASSNFALTQSSSVSKSSAYRTLPITIEQACMLDWAMQEYGDILKYELKQLQHYSHSSRTSFVTGK